MKRIGHLYDKITDIENIKLAIINASRKKRDRPAVIRVLEDIEGHALKIHHILETESYIPSPYYEVKIIDNSSCKERMIHKPKFFPDQVIHWAVMQIVQPSLLKGMYYYCCGSVPGRGGQRGYKAIKKWLKMDPKYTKYCLQIDVSKFYPSIDQVALKAMLRGKLKDERCLKLLDSIIESTEAGLPIGNYTSQWLANFYLEGLDHYIKEELGIKYYIRYMDDGVMFGNNKKALHKARRLIEMYLSRIKLKLKGNWQVFKVDARPIDFLGFRFYRAHVTMRRRNALRIRRRIRKVSRKPVLNYTDAAAIISYLGWIYNSNSYKYFEKYVKPYIDIKKLKEVIRHESRKQHNTTASFRS